MSINTFCAVCQDARIKDLMDDDQRAAHDAKERRARILAEVEAKIVRPKDDAPHMIEAMKAAAESAEDSLTGDDPELSRMLTIIAMAYALAAIEAIDKECGR